MNPPLVSIAIPTYNRADLYLKDALHSALEQNYPNLEIIVADNCSTDSTEQLLGRFKDRRINYVRHGKNIGANNNFNYCLNVARGDYFLLLHSDDLIDTDFVQSCMEQGKYRADLGFIQTGARVIDTDGMRLYNCKNRAGGLSPEQFFLAWFNDQTCWYFCNTLFNTRFLREIGGLRSSKNLIQDNVAIVKLASQHERVDVEDVKASFRKHIGQMTYAVKVKDWCDDYLFLIDLMCSVVDGNNEKIRKVGYRVLCRRNLSRANAVTSILKRYLTYYIVYRKFDYKYSPISYVYKNEIRPLLQKTQRRFVAE
jgi:glycosyltransferase involved in cell wall biosynthesis